MKVCRLQCRKNKPGLRKRSWESEDAKQDRSGRNSIGKKRKQGKNSRDLQRVPLEYSVKYSLAHECEETI